MEFSQKYLDSMHQKFKQLEKEASLIDKTPADKFLCVRLDGFKATKSYLKDQMNNKAFSKNLTEAVNSLYYSFRFLLNKEYLNSFVCAFSSNDEISFILFNKNNNFESRIIKICTLFSGILSAAMTLKSKDKKSKKDNLLFFDSRPIILKDLEQINEYLNYRYAISMRYGYWKILKLRKYPGVFGDYIKKDLEKCISIVSENGWSNEIDVYEKQQLLYIPEKSNKSNLQSMTVKKEEFDDGGYKSQIGDYLDYLYSNLRN